MQHPQHASSFSGPEDITVPPAISCFLPRMTENNPPSARWKQRVNEWQRGAAFRLPATGSGSPQQPAGDRCLSPSSGSCLGPPRRRGAKGKGQRWKANKEKKDKKGTCKALKRQLKGKQEDTISESTKNKVSNISLTRVTQTSSFHTRALDLVRERDTVTVTLLAASAAHTFCLKKPPITFKETFP